MRKLLLTAVAAFALFCRPAQANFTFVNASSSTITAFAFDGSTSPAGTSNCASTTECSASVPINTAGSPLFVPGAPGYVTGSGGTFPVTQSGTWTMQPGNTPNTSAWLVTGSGGTFPVTGTFWQTTQPVSLASLPSVALNTTPSLANGNGVVPTQGGAVLSATNGDYANLLQGNAVLSATNGLYANLLQGNAALSSSNPIFASLAGSTLPAFASTPTVNLGTLNGAATAANQEVTAAGTSASSAQAVQGVSGGVALAVSGTFWQTTQPASLNSTPSLANGNGVVPTQGGAVLSATNGGYTNLLQGNAVLSASNPLFVEGNAASGSAVAGNPNLMGGSDGTDVRNISTDASGHLVVEPGNTANTTAWLVTGSGGTFPVTGTFWQTTQPVSLASLPALASGANTIGAVTQASGPWTANLTQLDGSALGAPSNYGTSPGAVEVQGVNAYVTNTVPVTGTFWQTTQPVSLASLPALASGANTIGAVTQASGPWTSNLTQVDSTALGAPVGWGSTPSGNVLSANVNCIAGCSASTVASFTPSGNYANLSSVTTTTGNVALPSGSPTTIMVYNTGSSPIAVKLGTSNAVTVTATTGDVIGPGSSEPFTVGSNTYLAAIVQSATGTSSLTIAGGSGLGTQGAPSTVTVGNSNANGQATMSASSPVVIASNQSSLTVNGGAASGSALSGNPVLIAGGNGTNAYTLKTDTSGDLFTNLADVGGAAIALGSTTASASIPVVLASNQTAADPCMFQAKSNAAISTASGTTALVTGSSGKKVYVCSLSLIAPSAVSVSLAEGSSATCGTSNQAAVIGVATNGTAANGMPLAANGGLTLGNGGGTVAATATSADYLCLFQSGTAQLAGNLTYVQQ